MRIVLKGVAIAVALQLTWLGLLNGQQTGLILATPTELNRVPLTSTPYSGAALSSTVDLSGDPPDSW